MYAKAFTNKKGEKKVQVLLTLEEAKKAVDSPSELVEGLKRAIGEQGSESGNPPPGTAGKLDGLEMLFHNMEERPGTSPETD